MIQDHFQLFIVLSGVILLCVYLEKRFEFARKISAVVLIMFVAAAVSNVGLIPDDSKLYGLLSDFTIPFAVCLVLLRVNLADFKKAGLPLLVAFLIASAASVAGVIVAGVALEPFLHGLLGAESWKLAGPYTGTYIGGSLNFFALWEGLEIGNPDLFAAANAVDVLSLLPLITLWMILPDRLARRFPVADFWKKSEKEAADEDAKPEAPPALKVFDVVALCFIALVVMQLSELINLHLVSKVMPQIPTVLIVTTLALVLAQFGLVRRLQGAQELGNIAFYIFFAAVGAMMNIQKAISLSPILFAFVAIIMTVHFLVAYGVGRLFRLDIRIITIASSAAKSGPPTVLALANLKGWRELALPGVVMGLFGYALGNYAGVGTAYLLKFLLGA